MKPQTAFSPISLRYIAALRGNRPKKTGTEVSYAEAACTAPEKLICLAASNPEGRFYGFVADEKARRTAEDLATERGTFNVIFLLGAPTEILARLANGSSLPPMLDYLCCDESIKPLAKAERDALFELAHKRMNPGGLLVTSYRSYDRDDGALRFMVKEMAGEMDNGQKQEFLTEIKTLGSTFLAKHPDLAKKLDEAITKKAPQDFFKLFDDAPAASTTFATQVSAGKNEFAYAGDAILASNFVELAVPAEAQDLIASCRANPLYETIKDFALDRAVRNDIWIKTPVEQSANPGQLFGGFAYGLLVEPQQIPSSFAAKGKIIDLSAPLYGKLTALMTIMPFGVGDALSHPSCQGEKPEKILETLQMLVACGFASPMRGTLSATKKGTTAQPKLVGSFNRFLDKTNLTDKEVMFASQVAGCAIALPAREAFVMQALNRAGLNNSVSALMPELRRIANTPMAMSVIKADEPTAEIAHALILEIVGKSLPQWYAYALLEAA